jgi:hypothetical protein
MKKIKINSITQGLILMTLGFIADTYLLGFLLYFFRIENFLFIVLFTIIDIFILVVINQLLKERNNK